MGIIIREFRCNDCGATFESSDAPQDVFCPHCAGDEPERVYLTPPAIKSAASNVKDAALKDLASAYGLSDMSNKHGEAVKRAPSGEHAPQFAEQNPQTMAVLNKLPANARDGFSPFMGKLATPNQAMVGRFPFENRKQLFEKKP